MSMQHQSHPDDSATTISSLPNTPVGRHVAHFLAALNTGDSATLRTFMQAHSDPALLAGHLLETHVARQTMTFLHTGGLIPWRIERAGDHNLTLLARARRTPAVFQLTVQVATEPPHHITGYDLRPALRPADALVDIGGRQLAFNDAGAGSPTVILEAGLGGTRDTWDWVVDAIATFARVVSYDRAGRGASDPAPTPRTSRDMVSDLRALLGTAAIPGPYVLVGHSLGGLNVRLFTHRYPDEVAGLILIDPTRPAIESANWPSSRRRRPARARC